MSVPGDTDFPSSFLLRSGLRSAPRTIGRLVASYWAEQTENPAKVMIREAMRRAGLDPARLSRNDLGSLAHLDEFHCLGAQATLDLAQLVGIGPEAHVLDVGSGIGGPSRRLAIDFGCRVVGVDITKEYVEAAQGLAESFGLAQNRVSYRHGDAVDMPFRSASFDVVWLQVATTNIRGRDRLYAEIRRVMKPNGRAALFDIFAGPGGPVHFPVPWGYDESTSALLTHEETELELAAAGLRIVQRQDVSEQATGWFHEQIRLTSGPGGRPDLGFHVLLPDWGRMAYNQWRNLRERRIFFTYLVLEHA